MFRIAIITIVLTIFLTGCAQQAYPNLINIFSRS